MDAPKEQQSAAAAATPTTPAKKEEVEKPHPYISSFFFLYQKKSHATLKSALDCLSINDLLYVEVLVRNAFKKMNYGNCVCGRLLSLSDTSFFSVAS